MLASGASCWRACIRASPDILPTRLGFYESWLHAKGLRDGTIGLAPLYAVLSFLRQEGDALPRITTSAGEYAAEWTVQSMGSFERSLVEVRAQLAARPPRAAAADRLVSESYRAAAWSCGSGADRPSLDLRASVFCTVREPVPHPLCGFYMAAFARLFALFELPAKIEVMSCRGRAPAAYDVRSLITVTHRVLQSDHSHASGTGTRSW